MTVFLSIVAINRECLSQYNHSRGGFQQHFERARRIAVVKIAQIILAILRQGRYIFPSAQTT